MVGENTNNGSFSTSETINPKQVHSIQIGFIDIIISLVIILVLGLITILSQTWKAADSNPVKI
jgi:putative ABC transport system permease protein